MRYIGGAEQGPVCSAIRNAEKQCLMAALIIVGKSAAAALVSDFWGEIVKPPPFEFNLNESGLSKLRAKLALSGSLSEQLLDPGRGPAGNFVEVSGLSSPMT